MNRGPNRGGSAAIRYPVRTWLGKYESYLLTMYGSRSFYTADYLLEKFLTHFPNVRSLDEFSVVDISEYFRWRLECGRNPHTLGQELQAVDRWYCWLIEDKGLPLLNPAKGFRSASEQRTKNENRLTLSEYRRLLDVCEAPARDYLVGLAFGQERKTGWDPGQMGRYLCARFRELGLPYTTIQAFRRAIRRSLWRRSFGFITSRSTTPCLRNPSRLAAPSLRSKSLPQTYGPRSRTTTSRMLCGCAGFIKRRWVPKGRVLEAAVISFGLNGLPSARVEPLSFPYQLVVKTCGVGIGMLSEDDTIPPIL